MPYPKQRHAELPSVSVARKQQIEPPRMRVIDDVRMVREANAALIGRHTCQCSGRIRMPAAAIIDAHEPDALRSSLQRPRLIDQQFDARLSVQPPPVCNSQQRPAAHPAIDPLVLVFVIPQRRVDALNGAQVGHQPQVRGCVGETVNNIAQQKYDIRAPAVDSLDRPPHGPRTPPRQACMQVGQGGHAETLKLLRQARKRYCQVLYHGCDAPPNAGSGITAPP